MNEKAMKLRKEYLKKYREEHKEQFKEYFVDKVQMNNQEDMEDIEML